VLVITCGGLLWLTFPSANQDVAIPGLAAPVSITIDQDGVPRLRAASETDAAAALGFMHARDRMFQLELLRRSASGRLSELVGPQALAFDREMRVLGLRYRAIADYGSLPAGDRAVLEAYARGVNAWIGVRGRFSAPEFILLGAPEAWTPVDSLLWAKTMGLWLAGNWQQELARLALSVRLPAERIAQLWPGRAGASDVPPDAGVVRANAATAAALLDAMPHFPEPFTLPSTDSNGWAVGAALSATGSPLLAGDPHLLYALPGLWYLARIERPDGIWAGATAPGVPDIMMGRNSDIAWTFTTTGADTQDVFIETPAGTGMYATPDGPKPFATREEIIRVRGQADVVLHVRETRHGPVISDIKPDPGSPLLSVAMAGLAPGDTAASGFLALNRARSVREAGAAAAKITSPVQNMIVADVRHIALFTTGRVPIRRSGDGSEPALGSDGSHDWIRFASGSELPVILDPPSEYIANANEPVMPADFPVFIGRDVQTSWRAQRIDALLRAPGRRTIDDLVRMQTDTVSEFARRFVPVLRALALPDGRARRAASQLQDWDGTMSADSPAPLIFNAWLTRFREDVLRRAGVPERSPAVSQLGFLGLLLSPQMDASGRAFWCGGPCDGMLAAALESATADLAARLGDDAAKWRWGAVHQAVFPHPVMRSIPVLGALTEARIAVPGDTTTINRQEALFGNFESVHGAAYRGVYDLADLDRSRFMTTPGQSGNLLSATARVFLRHWANGETVELGPTATTIAARLQLTPAVPP
jgi:penicillin amidase